jgi:hypothetical protein
LKAAYKLIANETTTILSGCLQGALILALMSNKTMHTLKSQILFSKDDLDTELFQIYFKLLNRVNILIELTDEISEDENSKVQHDALLIVRERLELAKAEYYNSIQKAHD